MADNAIVAIDSARPRSIDSSPLGEPVDFDVRGLGRRLPRTDAPEGWIKKIERRREGKVWVGFFHLWTTDSNGLRVRQKKEKTLGPASMPKHEAQSKLAGYIEEYTGRITKQGSAICTFADLWNAYCAVKSGQWAKKTREDLRYLFAKHVIPIVGSQPPREVTLTSLQLLLNKMAQDGYRKSAVETIRTHTRACFVYAVDEEVLQKNPARKLVMPNIKKKSCERFLSLDELRALLSQASPREHVVLRILAVCGLRAAEILVLRIEDFEGTQLRIDEALKERQKGEDRIGETKTAESDNYVPVPPDLAGEIATWIAGHPDRGNPRAFLFPNSDGGAFGVWQLSKTAPETVGRESRDSRSHIPGIPPLLFDAHTEPCNCQGHAAPPAAHQPPDYSQALCEGDPRELAFRRHCPGCPDYRCASRVEMTSRRNQSH